MLVSSIGLYHLKNYLKSRTKRSDLYRYHIVCKFEERCKFNMQSKALGLSLENIHGFLTHVRHI